MKGGTSHAKSFLGSHCFYRICNFIMRSSQVARLGQVFLINGWLILIYCSHTVKNHWSQNNFSSLGFTLFGS